MTFDDFARRYYLGDRFRHMRTMTMVTHHPFGVVTWRDGEGYHNAAIDWQWQRMMRPNYPVPAIAGAATSQRTEDMSIKALQAAANAFLDGESSYDNFYNSLIAIFDNLGVKGYDNDETTVWLAKAIAERDLPANHRLIGVGK